MDGSEARKTKIEVRNLTKRFGDLLVLDEISFNVGEGEFLSIGGPTGCGKTTFLNTLSKLIPSTAGDISSTNASPPAFSRRSSWALSSSSASV